jgi:hypothetical protein
MNDHLDIPDFKPDLPEYILKDLAASERYTLENISVVRQYMGWQNTILKETCDLARKTNGRVTKLENESQLTKEEISEIRGEQRLLKPIMKGFSFAQTKVGGLVTVGAIFILAFLVYPYLLSLGSQKLLSLFLSLFS